MFFPCPYQGHIVNVKMNSSVGDLCWQYEEGKEKAHISKRADLASATHVKWSGQLIAVANQIFLLNVPRLLTPVLSSDPGGRWPAASDTKLKQPSGAS